MFTKKNSAMFVIIAALSGISFVVGAECGAEVKRLYGNLLRSQGANNPMNTASSFKFGYETVNSKWYQNWSEDAHKFCHPVFTALFQRASKTGLMAEYKRLILSGSEPLSIAFCAPANLQIIAYMQNVYGGGKPFAYDPKRGMQQLGGDIKNLVNFGNYTNVQNQTLIMTRYGILNGIIDAMVALDREAPTNQQYKSFCAAFKQSLIEAIELSSRQK